MEIDDEQSIRINGWKNRFGEQFFISKMFQEHMQISNQNDT